MEEYSAKWLLPISISLLTLFFFLKFKKKQNKPKNLPPSPPSLPLIGHLHLIKEPLHRSLHKLSQIYGHMVFLRAGTRNILVVSSPSAIQECLSNNDITFANRPLTLAGKYLHYNSTTLGFSSYGELWRKLRRLTTSELFSTNRLAMFARVREEEVTLLVKQIFEESKGQLSMSKVDIKTKTLELSFNIILRVITGKRYYGKDVVALEGKEFQTLMKEFLELLGSGNLNDFFPILKWIDFQGKKKKMVKLMKKMDSFLQKLVDEKQRNRNHDQTTTSMTLIDVMLDLQQKEPEFYTNEVMKGVVLIMLVAGSETSATSMQWTLSLLLNHPKTMIKVRAEIDTCVRHDQLMTESEGSKLKYLSNVIMEALRLYPVAPLMIPHESSNDCKVCGFDIPRGTMLLVNLWTLHRDPNLWEDPTKFVPERFEEGELGNFNDIYNMLPFGIGRRSCPGDVLAKRVMGHAIGSLIQCFEWERIGAEEIDMTEGFGITMPKVEPLVALCKPRQVMIKAMSNI
ncbi:cytochrome P450 81Q32-like [Cicer arietinum]|uniref:Isoflavone 2'-hydroxylase-like n=1 Tax=Cicer arietinum TaxID=3827 RepID=A0A1S2YJC7_CICAR|nr:isoflavone 2'-hydroxylase-like [Cicer arietinum]